MKVKLWDVFSRKGFGDGIVLIHRRLLITYRRDRWTGQVTSASGCPSSSHPHE